jgi:hypothetical protein
VFKTFSVSPCTLKLLMRFVSCSFEVHGLLSTITNCISTVMNCSHCRIIQFYGALNVHVASTSV